MKKRSVIVSLVLLACCFEAVSLAQESPQAANQETSMPVLVPEASALIAQTRLSLNTYPTMTLELQPQTPVAPVNLPANPVWPSKLPEDLAWNKPTFASSYWQDHYPSGSTSGQGFWLCAGSTGSWFYVDLLEPRSIHAIITTLFVDANFSAAPRTTFITSNDLKVWQRVIEEHNTLNEANRGRPRMLILPQDVTARYVGLYAEGWDGGWADQTVFAVLPHPTRYLPLLFK